MLVAADKMLKDALKENAAVGHFQYQQLRMD